MPHSERVAGGVCSNFVCSGSNTKPNSGSFTGGRAAAEAGSSRLSRPAINLIQRLFVPEARAGPEVALDEVGDPVGAVIALDMPIFALACRLHHRDVGKLRMIAVWRHSAEPGDGQGRPPILRRDGPMRRPHAPRGKRQAHMPGAHALTERAFRNVGFQVVDEDLLLETGHVSLPICAYRQGIEFYRTSLTGSTAARCVAGHESACGIPEITRCHRDGTLRLRARTYLVRTDNESSGAAGRHYCGGADPRCGPSCISLPSRLNLWITTCARAFATDCRTASAISSVLIWSCTSA